MLEFRINVPDNMNEFVHLSTTKFEKKTRFLFDPNFNLTCFLEKSPKSFIKSGSNLQKSSVGSKG